MATRVLVANANLSTSAGSWRRVEASSLVFSNYGGDDLGTIRTQAVTFANAGNQVGIWLAIGISNIGTAFSGNLTIKLQENTGAWVDRTVDVFALTQANFDGIDLLYFALTSYAVTAAAATWRYAIQFSVASRITWRNTTGPIYVHAACLDVDSSSPGAGDTVIIANGVTLTLDESASYANIYISQSAILQCQNPPSAAYTLTLTGQDPIKVGSSGSLIIGTQASPIPAANRFTINWTEATNSTQALVRGVHYGQWAVGFRISIWGAEDTYLAERCGAAAASQDKVPTTRDLSAIWSVGDTVHLFGKSRAGTDTEVYTLDAVSATELDLNANLDYALYAGAHAVNLSRNANLGVMIQATVGPGRFRWIYNAADAPGLDSIELVGVYLHNFSAFVNGCYFSNTSGGSVLRSLLQYCSDANYTIPFICIQNSSDTQPMPSPFLVENCHRISVRSGQNTSYYAIKLLNSNSLILRNVSVKNSRYDGWVNSFYLGGVNITLDDVVGVHGIASVYSYGVGNIVYMVNVANLSMTDCLFADAAYTVYMQNVNKVQARRCSLQRGTVYDLALRTAHVGAKWVDCEMGSVQAAGTAEIYVYTSAYVNIGLNRVQVGATFIANHLNMVSGSYVKSDTHDAVTNDHRSWWDTGLMQSTGDGLTDTTVHTAGAGKFALRFEPQSSLNRLEWTHDAPTGNIQGQTMTVAVWCKINNAAYYAGVHQNPRLTVDYDDGTLAYAEAVDGTDWQLLSVVFTPTMTYGQITITMSGMTDAVGANAYVYWDDGLMLYPASYVLNMGGMDLFANALPVTPLIATVFSAVDVWTAQTSVMTGAGTIGKRLADNVDAPISGRAPAATALSNVDWTNARASALDYLDALISSRLAAGDYVAPDNAGILAALATAQADLDNPDQYKADISGLAVPGDEMALTGAAIDAIIADMVTALTASGKTPAQALRILLAVAAGVTRGMADGAPEFDAIDASGTVIEATQDDDGNRTTVTIT